MAICPNCQNETTEGAVFCDQCGAPLPAPEPSAPEPAAPPAGGSVICAACGAGNVPGEAFCDFCGSPLEAPAPSAEVAAGLEAVSPEGEAVEVAADAVEEAPPAGASPTCPACGAEVLADEAFCANCGASLAQPPISPEPVADIEPEPPIAPIEGGVEPEAVPEAPPAAPPELTPEPSEGATQVPVAELPEPVPAAPAAEGVCPACGAEVEPGDKFCSNCGAVLAPIPTPVPAPEVAAPPLAPSTPVGPRLQVVASGAEIPLAAGPELLIGREDPVSGIFPDIDLTPHGGEEGGVSRRHARLIVEGGTYFVEDLDSTNFTFINKQKLSPGSRQPLNDGDELRCGRVALILRSG